MNYGTFLGVIRDCLIQKELEKAGFEKQKKSFLKAFLVVLQVYRAGIWRPGEGFLYFISRYTLDSK